MISKRPSVQRSKSWAAGLNRSGNISWVIKIILEPSLSASARMAFSDGLIKGEMMTPPLAPVCSHRSRLVFRVSSLSAL